MTMRKVAENIISARQATLDYAHLKSHARPGEWELVLRIYLKAASLFMADAGRALQELKGWGDLRTVTFGIKIVGDKVEQGVNHRLERVGPCPGLHEYTTEGLGELEEFLREEGSP